MDKIEVTQADRTLYHQLLSLGSVNLNRRRMGLPIVDGFELIAAHRLATRTDATPVAWMPIDSAPKDGTVIDAWRDDQRETVYWGLPPHTCGEMGQYCDSDWHRIKEPGWICATFGEFVGCKHDPLTHWMPLPAAPDATNTHPPANDVAALVDAAKDLRDAIAHMAAPARVDPDKYFSEQVKAFGDAFGYGALMTTASALWRQSLGDLQGGECAVGPCVTTAANQLNRLSAALAPFTKALS